VTYPLAEFRTYSSTFHETQTDVICHDQRTCRNARFEGSGDGRHKPFHPSSKTRSTGPRGCRSELSSHHLTES
jgi:hypothetical protein